MDMEKEMCVAGRTRNQKERRRVAANKTVSK